MSAEGAEQGFFVESDFADFASVDEHDRDSLSVAGRQFRVAVDVDDVETD